MNSRTSIQDTYLDSIADGTVPCKRGRLTPALSLRPGPELAFGCACRNATALAIADAWRFRFPVTVMPAAEYDELVERSDTTFTGSLPR